MKRKNLFITIVFVEFVLFLIFFIRGCSSKSFYALFLAMITFNFLILCSYFFELRADKEDYCDRNLSHSFGTEVIPLYKDEREFIYHLAKIATFKAFLDGEDNVTIYVHFKNEDTDILYETIKKYDFLKFYEIK